LTPFFTGTKHRGKRFFVYFECKMLDEISSNTLLIPMQPAQLYKQQIKHPSKVPLIISPKYLSKITVVTNNTCSQQNIFRLIESWFFVHINQWFPWLFRMPLSLFLLEKRRLVRIFFQWGLLNFADIMLSCQFSKFENQYLHTVNYSHIS